jgi:iron complex outermembrane receptor protein
MAAAVAAAMSTGGYAEDAVVVTASPFDNHDELEMAQPASVLRGERLQRRQASNLGDTLSSEPGVHSSSFGPGSGRPIIRGLDGPRVRIMDNGLGSSDLSSVSPDHQATGEPINARQIEVLRGPATLLYGSGAIGGLVNVVNSRIPDSKIDGLHGNVDARGATGIREHAGSFALNGGAGSFAWHADGFKRKTGDYSIPGRQNPNDPASPSGRLPNSATNSDGMALGGSFVGERGYIGLSYQDRASRYGIPTPDNAQIDLHQHSWDVAGELADPLPGLSRARLKLRESDYRHDEIESTGKVGTSFKNKGGERRIELTHAPVAGWTGVFGVQHESSTISALGAEAIIPRTRNRETGVFLVEDVSWRDFHFELGGRLGNVSRSPDDPSPGRSFSLSSYSAGSIWKFTPGYALALSYTSGQRAPITEELYSNGAHVATGTFEVGNAGLGKERSRNIDLQLRKTAGAWRGKLGVFENRIKNYIFASSVDTNGDGVPDRVADGFNATGVIDPAGAFLLVNYLQAEARFRGFEGELAWRADPKGFGARVFGDRADGRLSGGANLPRIAPARVDFEADYKAGAFTTYGTLLHVYRQDRVAALESTTPGYTRLDAGVEYALKLSGEKAATLYLRGNNLLNRDMRVHTSFIKDFAPLPGRSLAAGVRVTF